MCGSGCAHPPCLNIFTDYTISIITQSTRGYPGISVSVGTRGWDPRRGNRCTAKFWDAPAAVGGPRPSREGRTGIPHSDEALARGRGVTTWSPLGHLWGFWVCPSLLWLEGLGVCPRELRPAPFPGISAAPGCSPAAGGGPCRASDARGGGRDTPGPPPCPPAGPEVRGDAVLPGCRGARAGRVWSLPGCGNRGFGNVPGTLRPFPAPAQTC